MRALLERHDFLVLALLFCVPPALLALGRPDLRPRLCRGALLALPFALTERFFYPEYWSPRFLFDLVDVLGFGVEDLLFVAAFGAFAVSADVAVSGSRLVPDGPRRGPLAVALALGGLIAAAVALHAAGAPMYVATVGVEAAGVACCVLARRDLALPALRGGLVVAAVYGLVCLAFEALLPGVFARVWHTEGLIDRAVAGVPLEELLYGGVSGALATVALPTLAGERHHPR